MAMRLTEKQKQFVEEYLVDLNATQAAIRAGYSVQNADKIGSELLGKTRVLEAIKKAMAKRSRRTGINQDRVIQELARVAFINPADVICVEDATVLSNATDDDLACIQSLKVKTMNTDKGSSEEREIKFYNKLDALEKLGKHLGMFNDRINLNADMELNITIDYGETDGD